MNFYNHDVILRPNYELVQIFKLFGGANDIAVLITNNKLGRINQELDWSFAGLNLFIDGLLLSILSPIKAVFWQKLAETRNFKNE
jgi:hypothetical protein